MPSKSDIEKFLGRKIGRKEKEADPVEPEALEDEPDFVKDFRKKSAASFEKVKQGGEKKIVSPGIASKEKLKQVNPRVAAAAAGKLKGRKGVFDFPSASDILQNKEGAAFADVIFGGDLSPQKLNYNVNKIIQSLEGQARTIITKSDPELATKLSGIQKPTAKAQYQFPVHLAQLIMTDDFWNEIEKFLENQGKAQKFDFTERLFYTIKSMSEELTDLVDLQRKDIRKAAKGSSVPVKEFAVPTLMDALLANSLKDGKLSSYLQEKIPVQRSMAKDAFNVVSAAAGAKEAGKKGIFSDSDIEFLKKFGMEAAKGKASRSDVMSAKLLLHKKLDKKTKTFVHKPLAPLPDDALLFSKELINAITSEPGRVGARSDRQKVIDRFSSEIMKNFVENYDEVLNDYWIDVEDRIRRYVVTGEGRPSGVEYKGSYHTLNAISHGLSGVIHRLVGYEKNDVEAILARMKAGEKAFDIEKATGLSAYATRGDPKHGLYRKVLLGDDLDIINNRSIPDDISKYENQIEKFERELARLPKTIEREVQIGPMSYDDRYKLAEYMIKIGKDALTAIKQLYDKSRKRNLDRGERMKDITRLALRDATAAEEQQASLDRMLDDDKRETAERVLKLLGHGSAEEGYKKLQALADISKESDDAFEKELGGKSLTPGDEKGIAASLQKLFKWAKREK